MRHSRRWRGQGRPAPRRRRRHARPRSRGWAMRRLVLPGDGPGGAGAHDRRRTAGLAHPGGVVARSADAEAPCRSRAGITVKKVSFGIRGTARTARLPPWKGSTALRRVPCVSPRAPYEDDLRHPETSPRSSTAARAARRARRGSAGGAALSKSWAQHGDRRGNRPRPRHPQPRPEAGRGPRGVRALRGRGVGASVRRRVSRSPPAGGSRASGGTRPERTSWSSKSNRSRRGTTTSRRRTKWLYRRRAGPRRGLRWQPVTDRVERRFLELAIVTSATPTTTSLARR